MTFIISILFPLLAMILPPCAQEDSPNCYWDALGAGNGLGLDFVDINGQAYYR